MGDKTSMKGYLKFIDNFGTHYFDNAAFDGRLQITRSISKSVLKKHSEQKIEATVGAEFMDYGITVESGYGDHDTKTDIEKSSEKFVQSAGGDANLFKKGDVLKWPETVKKSPTILSGRVRPIYGIIKDETHKSNMIKAVGQHILRIRAEALRQENEDNSNRDEINRAVDDTMRKDVVTEEDLKYIKMLTICDNHMTRFTNSAGEQKCYSYSPNPLGYSMAGEKCAELNMYLAMPKSKEENDKINGFMSTNAWIGVNDRINEGRYVYPNGNVITYNNWAPDGNPDNWRNEDCVHLRGMELGEWNDVGCDYWEIPYICEYSDKVDIQARETQAEQWRHVEWQVEVRTQNWGGTTAWCALKVQLDGSRTNADEFIIPGEYYNGYRYFDRDVTYTYTMVTPDIGIPTKITYWEVDCHGTITEPDSLAIRYIKLERRGYSDAPVSTEVQVASHGINCKLEPAEKCEDHCFGTHGFGDDGGWIWPGIAYETERSNC